MPDDTVHNYSTYSNRGCRCDECKAAAAAYQKKRRAERTALPLPTGRRHGVYTTYINYGCRCERCKQANTDRSRRLARTNAQAKW